MLLVVVVLSKATGFLPKRTAKADTSPKGAPFNSRTKLRKKNMTANKRCIKYRFGALHCPQAHRHKARMQRRNLQTPKHAKAQIKAGFIGKQGTLQGAQNRSSPNKTRTLSRRGKMPSRRPHSGPPEDAPESPRVTHPCHRG